MVDYNKLKSAILRDLAIFHNCSDYDIRMNSESMKSTLTLEHLKQLLMIEIALEEHRKKYAQPFERLDGVRALHHMVFLKTKWPIKVIEQLPLQEMLFAVLVDIRQEHLLDEAQNFLNKIHNSQYQPPIDLGSYTGWKIGAGQPFLKDS